MHDNRTRTSQLLSRVQIVDAAKKGDRKKKRRSNYLTRRQKHVDMLLIVSVRRGGKKNTRTNGIKNAAVILLESFLLVARAARLLFPLRDVAAAGRVKNGSER